MSAQIATSSEILEFTTYLRTLRESYERDNNDCLQLREPTWIQKLL